MKKRQKRILIIDDDQTIALILKEYLENKSYFVSYATQVSDVEGLVLKEKPNIIFLDYRMSPLTGKDILERISLLREPVPVVMMSAYRTREGLFEVQNLGAIDYISKPFDFEEIESLLNRVLP
ncbi:MAG: response regulator [Chlamydiae bacterium]|nr:response regulator [Chlamydiota bacterium]MBI3267197.1 response regulator [Chlamydiota bacterium]